jgi:signal transduction histidine kinase
VKALVLTLPLGVLALSAGILNLWVFALRRRARPHLWLGLVAVSEAALVVPASWLYLSTSGEMALALRTVQLVASLPWMYCFVRFCGAFLGTRFPRIERVVIALHALSFVGMLISFRDPLPVQRSIHWLGTTYVDALPSWVASAGFIGFLPALAYLCNAFRPYLRAGNRDAPVLVGAAAVWPIAVISDVAGYAGWVEMPTLHPFGVAAIVVAFTAVLTRRFVESMDQVARGADLLQRAAEERLRALREADLRLAQGEAQATIGTLAASLAHEINNPVAFISANLNYMLELRKEAASEAEFEEVLQETREGVERIRGIVEELLRLAKREEGRAEAVDLSRVVESTLPLARHAAGERVRLVTELAAVPPVRGDARLLGQVVANLVINAIQAIPETRGDGRVALRTSVHGDVVTLVVDDNGAGIPDDVRPHIFDPFFTTKEAGRGTGLGLAVCQELVVRHGGRIRVDTSPAGTCMTVELPVADAAGPVTA